MNLFELDPGIENIPELPPRDLLWYLYKTHDARWADYQFDNPAQWRSELINGTLYIVHCTLIHCQSIHDLYAVEKLTQTNWGIRWRENIGDIAADLNFIYELASGENSSAHADDTDRQEFFLDVVRKNESVGTFFDFPKKVIPAEITSEESALIELNNALRKAFIADSQHGHYVPENLAKLQGKFL